MKKSYSQELKESLENCIEVEVIRTPDTIAAEIRTTIRSTQRIMLDAAILIGKNLMEAKELVDYGGWENWLESSVEFSQSKANKYMQLAREYGENQESDLNPILSYTNALKLLALPEEDRKDFIDENDIEGMTVKELEEKIKAVQQEKEEAEALVESIRKEKEAADIEKTELEDQKAEIAGELERLKGSGTESPEAKAAAEQAIAEKEKELGAKELEIFKEREKSQKLQDKLEKFKADKEAAIREAKEQAELEAKKKATEESKDLIDRLTEEAATAKEEVEAAKAETVNALKKADLTGTENIVKLKVLIDTIQKTHTEAMGVLSVIHAEDNERGYKMYHALADIYKMFGDEILDVFGESRNHATSD